MKLVRWAVLGAFVLVPAVAAAQVYKCVDERGRTYYTDKPGPRCKGGGPEPAPKASAPGKAAQEQKSAPAAQAVQAQDKRTLEQRCASMRRELLRLATGQRVAAVSKKGEVAYQEDPTRERRLAELQEEMRGCP